MSPAYFRSLLANREFMSSMGRKPNILQIEQRLEACYHRYLCFYQWPVAGYRMVLEPNGLYSYRLCTANVDYPIVPNVNRSGWINPQFFQADKERHWIRLGGNIILACYDDDLEKAFKIGKQPDAMPSRRLLSLGIGD